MLSNLWKFGGLVCMVEWVYVFEALWLSLIIVHYVSEEKSMA